MAFGAEMIDFHLKSDFFQSDGIPQKYLNIFHWHKNFPGSPLILKLTEIKLELVINDPSHWQL